MKNDRKPWDRKRPRDGESIGGGYFVFRRGDSTGRIRPGETPFEHPSLEAATTEAARLAVLQPGYQFDILHVAASIVERPDVADEPQEIAA
jgi:hypothetical protein